MRRYALMALALASALAIAAVAFGQALVDGSDADYHAEGQIIGGNVQIQSDRAPDKGTALTTCDPDPRPAPHNRPTCSWATPTGSGREQTQLNGHIGRPDTDVSPNHSYTPETTDTRETLNGHADLAHDHGGGDQRFEGLFFADEDMHFRLTPRSLDAYLAPEGNANNRWRRICGTGVVEQFNNSGSGSGSGGGGGGGGNSGSGNSGSGNSGSGNSGSGNGSNNDPRSPFQAGQIRKFIVQTWDADWRDPSDNDGGNQDYWIIDILAPGSDFDTSTCSQPAKPQQPATPAPAQVAPAPLAPFTPSRVAPVAGAARLSGPGGCVSQAFRATVVGSNIAQVSFSLDGKRVKTLQKPSSGNRWSLRIVPSTLSKARHRVSAGVSFVPNARPRTTRARLAFQRCAQAAQRVAPQFTG